MFMVRWEGSPPSDRDEWKEGTRYNLYRALAEQSKPVDPRWEP